MDDDSTGRSSHRTDFKRSVRTKNYIRPGTVLILIAILSGVFLITGINAELQPEINSTVLAADSAVTGLKDYISFNHVIFLLFLLGCSAFFSASEVAFFSLHKLELRSMKERQGLERLVTHLMEHPGSLLTSILMGNSIVNVLLSVLLALPVDRFLNDVLELPKIASYAFSVAACTLILVFFGEIFPKVLVVRKSVRFAMIAAIPIYLVDRLLTPFRNAIILFTGALFKITRFSEMKPAPFMTDNEFFSLLSESEASGVIEKDEREMIQGILELSDVMVRELIVPRPDIVALKSGSTVQDALEIFRKHEYSRIPVYNEDLDHIAGILNAKDMLSYVVQGIMDQPIDPLLRNIQFIPETMTVANFVKQAQSTRAHLAVVVDEYGGTEGIVTLQDALREVVGHVGEDMLDDTRENVEEIGNSKYRVEGSLSLDTLQEITGRSIKDEDHTTVAGFIMDQSEKIPEEGDVLEHDGVKYIVEEVNGKRVSQLVVEVFSKPDEEEGIS